MRSMRSGDTVLSVQRGRHCFQLRDICFSLLPNIQRNVYVVVQRLSEFVADSPHVNGPLLTRP